MRKPKERFLRQGIRVGRSLIEKSGSPLNRLLSSRSSLYSQDALSVKRQHADVVLFVLIPSILTAGFE